MHFALIALLVVILVFGPRIWIAVVMRWHGQDIPGMPGTGGELAEHLVNEHGLDGVVVERTDSLGDHYDPIARAVRLSPQIYDGKSLTAVAVAAHEVGHAVQHRDDYSGLRMRTRLAPMVHRLGRLSVIVMSVAPIMGALTRHPVPFSLLVAVGLSGLIARMGLHLLTLPTEWDASFGRALPMLRAGQYIAPGEERAVARVLRAAAWTYFAAALADVLNLARWATLLLRR
ncbi:MAG: zinc metallopeptidase [Gammaproteobacteria bacterium]|nr:zinc metallopeptidase [Gammaproteobacteria bacterium]